MIFYIILFYNHFVILKYRKINNFFSANQKGNYKKDKNENDKIKKLSYKTKFIDSYRFMSTSLSNLVSNLSEGLHNDRCIDCKSCLDYLKNKDEQLIFRCFRCKKSYEKNFNGELIRRFAKHMNLSMEILTNLFCF